MTDGPSEFVCKDCHVSFDSKQSLAGHRANHQQRISNDDLLTELQRLAEVLDRAPKAKEMDADGAYSSSTYNARFGLWDEALAAAGLDPSTRRGVSTEAILDEIHRLADELGRPPTSMEMAEQGAYSASLAKNRFDTWNNALNKAGYRPHLRQKIPKQTLLEEIEHLSEELGRPPTAEEMYDLGRFSHRPYFRQFDGWQAAVRAAGYEPVGRPSGPDNHNWNPNAEERALLKPLLRNITSE